MIRYFLAILVPVVLLAQRQNLPSAPACGTLREDQLYNMRKTIEDNETPWLARLYDGNNTFICLGALISTKHLVAPAHCLDADISTIVLGNCKERQQCKVRHELDAYKQHPKHVVGSLIISNDIAIVRLREPIALTEYVQPICLPNADIRSMNFVGQYYILTGEQELGRLNSKVSTLIASKSRCQQAFKVFEISDDVICASTCDNGSKYLSGSILMGVSVKNALPDHYYLLGLLTLGTAGCFDSSPDIFQRIDRHVDWIRESINELEGT